MRELELLAPAKNIEIGIAAINAGADAVYIGAERFGARAKATNNSAELKVLIDYAHLFGAKIFLTLNTILYDNELAEAERLIWEMWKLGLDAIIIQDMSILEMNLPPIAIHASTQTNNRSVEKVKFLEDTGIQRVILARELSLSQITEIRSKTNIELEAFVHGALCVSYSGQCYISQHLSRRSANRGECMQACRLPYKLIDNEGTELKSEKYLLSLKDLNLSNSIEALAEAGISSFKIEGRMKDVDYVKNITFYYRKILDKLIAENAGKYKKASVGIPNFSFTPNPLFSFSRGATTYFINGREEKMASFQTPKSVGQFVGVVNKATTQSFEIQGKEQINNNDGLCWFDENDTLKGLKVNRVDGKIIFAREARELKNGTKLFRNYNHEFTRQLESNNQKRTIPVNLVLLDTENGFLLQAKTSDGFIAEHFADIQKDIAQNTEKALQTVQTQLKKSGDLPFFIKSVEYKCNNIYFLPISVLNEWRRAVLEKLYFQRIENYKPFKRENNIFVVPFPEQSVDYKANIANEKAKLFYEKRGVTVLNMAFEQQKIEKDAVLMHTKYCILNELGSCLLKTKPKFKLPLFIENNQRKFRLVFDCKNCEMLVKTEK